MMIATLGKIYTSKTNTIYSRFYLALSLILLCFGELKVAQEGRSIFDKLPRLAASIIPREYRS